jgi:hypothetical protein
MLRKMLLAASACALLLGTLVTPVAAQDQATVRDLNGIPGTRIDICIVGAGEIISNLPYGRATDPTVVPAGTWRIQVRVAAAGSCKGTKLLTKDVVYEAGKDLTFVYWRPNQAVAVKVFENDLALPTEDAVTLVMRHAAKAGPIDVWLWQHVKPAVGEFDPTFDDLAKGQQAPRLTLDERQTMLEAFPAGENAGWGYEYYWTYLYAGGAYEAYFLGNARGNYRLVVVGQAGTFTPTR